MANITITTPTEYDARISDAFDAEFPGRTEAGMTKAQWIKRQLVLYIKQVVRNHEANAASATARNTVNTEVDGINIT